MGCAGSKEVHRPGRGGGAIDESSPLEIRIRKEWDSVNEDGDDYLDLKEIALLLNKLNCNIRKRELKKRFKQFDVDGNGKLDLDEFREFFKTVQSQPLEASILFAKFVNEAGVMTPKELRLFLLKGQGEPDGPANSLQACARMIRHVRAQTRGLVHAGLFPEETKSDLDAIDVDVDDGDDYLSLDHFTYFVTHPVLNGLKNPAHRRVYQDMTRPLAHYFISSTHNSYLEGNQLNSNSSVKPIVRSLLMGARVIELDCYDGPRGPEVYHGGTLTSHLAFEDAIVAIGENAFKASQYPVIVTLENHCGVDQQLQQAKILHDVLGARLFVPDEEFTSEFASPEALKGRVLIRDKPLKKKKKSRMSGAQAEALKATKPGRTAQDRASVAGAAGLGARAAAGAGAGAGAAVRSDGEGSGSGAGAGEEDEDEDDDDEDPAAVAIAPQLLRLIYIRNQKFPGPRACNDKAVIGHAISSSFNENKMTRLGSTFPQEMLQYAQTNLARVYPAGHRVDSSNYDPHFMWACGAQIVALNYQDPNVSVWANQAKFADNGGCGYVLKPRFQMAPVDALKFDPSRRGRVRLEMTVRVISAHYLPKPGGQMRGEIVDPFVEVSVMGVPADCAKHATRAVLDNGFNPRFDEAYSFKVTVPELATMMFQVRDADPVGSEFLGQAVIALANIRKGFRVVQLSDELSRPVENAYVFIELQGRVPPARRAGSTTRRAMR